MDPCYKLNHLKLFSDNIFANGIKYTTIIGEIEKCLKSFQEYGLKTAVGFAIDMSEHNVETCTLILSILNFDCHFFCVDLKYNKDDTLLLQSSGVEYMISDDPQIFNQALWKLYGSFIVFETTYFVGKIKTAQTTEHLEICYTISTSGSTGTPKIVHVPFSCIYPNIKALCSILEITQHDKILLVSPPTFDPFVVEFFMAIEKGASLIVVNRTSRLTPSANVLRKITILQTTPSVLRSFGTRNIRDLFHPKSSLRCLLLGGEEFPSMQEIQLWLPRQVAPTPKPVRIFNIYGITEYSCWATINECTHLFGNGNLGIALGKPLDNVTKLQINAIDDDMPLPEGSACKGELLIGSFVRHCYIPQFDKNMHAWRNNEIIFRRTGDLVERDAEGNLYYIGRVNNCIKRLGKRLCLDSLENKLGRLFKKKAICIWHNTSKQLLICFVSEKQEDAHAKQNLQSVLKNELCDYEQPDQIKFINEIPLSKHGKIDRQQLLKNIVEAKEKISETPLTILKSFLDNVLGIKMANITNKTESPKKRLKNNLELSFTAAGGTSFHALSLSMQIGEIMQDSDTQRQLLEMLLSSETTLQNITHFLKNYSRPRPIAKSLAEAMLRIPSNINMLDIKMLWRADLRRCVDASPSIHDNVVSVGSHSHIVLSFNTKTGEEVSRVNLSDRIECPVVFISRDLATVGCYDGILYGFDFRRGKISWQLNVHGMIKAKPIVTKELIIVASYAEEFNIHAFELKTLSSVWQFKLGNKGIFSSPLQISDDLILFCNLDGYYALIEITSGFPKWIKQLESPIFSTPAQLETVSKGLILAEVKGRVVVCSSENGDEIAYFQADGNIFSGITVQQANSNENVQLFFGCHDKNVYCLNYKTTTKHLSFLWKIGLNAAVYSTPIVGFEGTLVACSTKGSVVLIDLRTSQLKGIYSINCEIFSTPCISDNKYIYVGSRDNFLYALEAH